MRTATDLFNRSDIFANPLSRKYMHTAIGIENPRITLGLFLI
jgi:hypothetical protein